MRLETWQIIKTLCLANGGGSSIGTTPDPRVRIVPALCSANGSHLYTFHTSSPMFSIFHMSCGETLPTPAKLSNAETWEAPVLAYGGSSMGALLRPLR